MTEPALILSAVACALGVVSLILLVLLLKRGARGNGGELKDLAEKTEAVRALAEYNARTTENLSRATEARLENIQARLSEDLKYISEVNARNLEVIRRTVDDKLSSSLDGKLSDSYARITERLEKMYESVGEMKGLSASVGDIKRVLSNVKLRGTWGEAQLRTQLEQMLAPDQYRANVKLNPLDTTLADFAVLLPDREGRTVYLPIDSKFPVEEFERLARASEQADKEGEERARKNLERAVKLQADSISKKYILPPITTDFALMYLPVEGLYLEVLKMDGIADFLRARRITVCGPTNLGALLSLLQTGFRTAAIERRSGELRQMLEQFRVDFAKFSELLEKTRRKLQEAQDSVESAEHRTETIGRRLDSFRGLGGKNLPGGEDNSD